MTWGIRHGCTCDAERAMYVRRCTLPPLAHPRAIFKCRDAFSESPGSVFACYFTYASACRYQAVWSVFREVRRPQAPLVRDLVSGVLHPVLLSMPELNGEIALSNKVCTESVSLMLSATGIHVDMGEWKVGHLLMDYLAHLCPRTGTPPSHGGRMQHNPRIRGSQQAQHHSATDRKIDSNVATGTRCENIRLEAEQNWQADVPDKLLYCTFSVMQSLAAC